MAQRGIVKKSGHGYRPYRTVSRTTLIRRARRLSVMLPERARIADEARHLPDTTRKDLRVLGLARILQPSSYGGSEAHLSGMVDILSIVGAACGSTAWCLAQYIGHNFMMAQWPKRAQDEVWGADPRALISGILIPLRGRTKKVRGGYEVSGTFPFVSGVMSCDWCLFAATDDKAASADLRERYFVLPRSGFDVIDTWDAIGLRGSGSHDVRLESTFVPSHMTLPLRHLKGGDRSPGRRINSGPLYRSPSYMTFGILISSASVGIADGMVSSYVNQIQRTPRALMSGSSFREQSLQHVKISEATMAVESAKALLHSACKEIMEILSREELPSDEQRAKYRAVGAYAGKLAFQAANLIWDAAGARGVYMKNPIARAYRDLCTATRHFTHSFDVNGTTHGRVRAGLATDNAAL